MAADVQVFCIFFYSPFVIRHLQIALRYTHYALRWNFGTLKLSVKRKEIPFMTHLSARHSKPNALRFTLYALRY